jgi:hypothetical protein
MFGGDIVRIIGFSETLDFIRDSIFYCFSYNIVELRSARDEAFFREKVDVVDMRILVKVIVKKCENHFGLTDKVSYTM